jgi:hypothetical protein
MSTEPLPPGVYPIAVDKYIISYDISEETQNSRIHKKYPEV